MFANKLEDSSPLDIISDDYLFPPPTDTIPEKKPNIIRYTEVDKLDIKFPSCMMICGASQSGKSTLIKRFLEKNLKSFDSIFIMSFTGNINGEYSEICPNKKHILLPDDNGISTLERVISEQEKYVSKWKLGINRMLILVDNFSGMNLHGGAAKNLFNKLASYGRHIDISVIFITQKFTSCGPMIRDNCQYFMVTKISRECVENNLFKNQNSISCKYKFFDYYNRITSDVKYSALFINNHDCYKDNLVPVKPVTL